MELPAASPLRRVMRMHGRHRQATRAWSVERPAGGGPPMLVLALQPDHQAAIVAGQGAAPAAAAAGSDKVWPLGAAEVEGIAALRLRGSTKQGHLWLDAEARVYDR